MDLKDSETSPQSTSNEDNSSTNGLNSLASNIDAKEVEGDIEKKLRGDAIGNTMYSESFVAKTLLQLSEVKWSDCIEEDLCFLWDMTTEEDVCEYLLRLSYPTIACNVLITNNESRLIEIIIGILANIYCISSVKNISDEEIDIVLSRLSNDDPLILIQVVRFLEALSFQSTNLTFITESLIDQLEFILENSMNSQLLQQTLSALSAITSENRINESFIKGSLIRSTTIAYQSIFKIEFNDLVEYEVENNLQQKTLQHLMQIIANICSYINISTTDRLLNQVQENSDILLEEIVKILKYYSTEENLLPFDASKEFLFDTLAFTFQLLRVNYISDIFICLITICSLVLKNNFEQTDTFMELICYFIGIGDIESVKKDVNVLERKEVVSILNEINAKNPSLEISYVDNFTLLYSDYK